MDKFDKLIKQAVERYEAPFNPQAWDNVSNELGDSFDQMMKESTANYEAPYNPAAWDAVNNSLGPAYSAWKWIGGSAAVIAIVAGVSYFTSNNEVEENNTTQNSEEIIVHNETIANNEMVHDGSTELIVMNDDAVIESDENNVAENPIHEMDYDVNAHVNHIDVNVEENGNNNEIDNNQVVENNNENSNTHSNGTSNQPDGNEADQTIQYKADAKFSMSSDEICAGDKCDFRPVNANEDLKYVWNFGDGGLSSTINATHKFRKAGEFTVTLEVHHPKTNEVIASNTESIVVNELPVADFAFSRANEGIPTYTFVNESYGADVMLWNVKGLKQSTNEEFEYTFRKKGNYHVSLITKNEFGCTNKVEKKVAINADYNLLAPTAFTPNGDNGNNTFIPKALQVMDVDFTMTVQDKTGKLVYTTQNAFEGWDGRYTEDNTLAPSGSSYIWRVVLINSLGEREFYEGQVFVIY